MRNALNKTGRPIYYSVTESLTLNEGADRMKMHCYGPGVFTVKPWVAEGKDPTTLANSYLVEYCNNLDFFGYTGGVPRPGGTLSQLDSQALLTFDNLTKSGAYNDPDMLTICNGGQSDAEYRAQFSTWSILTAPLILGNDLRNLSASCAAIILNKEVIAVRPNACCESLLKWPFVCTVLYWKSGHFNREIRSTLNNLHLQRKTGDFCHCDLIAGFASR